MKKSINSDSDKKMYFPVDNSVQQSKKHTMCYNQNSIVNESVIKTF